MKDLRTLSGPELEEFLNSFDLILSDMDGVLWNLFEEIPGVGPALKSIQEIGKKMIFISNNSTKSPETYSKQFETAGFDLDVADVVTPISVMVDFLKKQNLSKNKVFTLGSAPLRDALEDAGFQVAKNMTDRIPETLPDLVKATTTDDGSVAVVIADIDVNVNWVNIQQGITYLKRPEVLFLKGATDHQFPGSPKLVMSGCGYFHDMMEDMAGREALPMAKPSPYLHQYVVEKYKIEDISRILFIGDSIEIDMAFATDRGYKKLLVLSGLAGEEDVENWKFPEETKPDYYAGSLKDVHDLIERHNKQNKC